MSEELDQAATAFTTEIAPASRPRDVAGKFVETRGAPESMFGPREVEGGDDAGDDPGRRSREVEVRRGDQRQTDRDDDNDDVHGTLRIVRKTRKQRTKPNARPAPAARTPEDETWVMAWRMVEPRAMRMPISRVRWVTRLATSAKMPTALSSSASAAMVPSRATSTRCSERAAA